MKAEKPVILVVIVFFSLLATKVEACEKCRARQQARVNSLANWESPAQSIDHAFHPPSKRSPEFVCQRGCLGCGGLFKWRLFQNGRSGRFKPRWIDDEFIPPRTWTIENVFRREIQETITERDQALMSDHFYRPLWRGSGDVVQDYCHFYSRDSLRLLALGVGIHAILANTDLDREFQDAVQRNAVGNPGAWQFAKNFGENWTIISLAAIWAAGRVIDRRSWLDQHHDRNLDNWAGQSLRAMLVGAPVTGVMQNLIGSSRPSENVGSRWRPFNDNNGASGHAFVGAVPFLVGAKYTDSVLLKSTLIVASALPAYSRIYDDAHYLSQAALGWWIAYLSVEATELTEQSDLQYRVVPLNLYGVVGIGVEFRR